LPESIACKLSKSREQKELKKAKKIQKKYKKSEKKAYGSDERRTLEFDKEAMNFFFLLILMRRTFCKENHIF
jgi:CelD/BcsL family acetyltransferase involved in cellulose biosynthesis